MTFEPLLFKFPLLEGTLLYFFWIVPCGPYVSFPVPLFPESVLKVFFSLHMVKLTRCLQFIPSSTLLVIAFNTLS